MEGPGLHVADYVQWAFYSLICFIGMRGVAKLDALEKALEALKTVTALLNEKLVVVITKVDTHEKRLDKHDLLIDDIERNS